MFVYSVKASNLKFFLAVFFSVGILIALVLLVPAYTSETMLTTNGNEINFSDIKTEEDRIKFISQFGWTVDTVPVEEVSIKIPDNFDKVFLAYNNIQKSQGLDLSKYKGKSLARYTYKVTNYPDYEGTVYLNMIVYRGKVVGGDICSSDPAGFVYGLGGQKTEI